MAKSPPVQKKRGLGCCGCGCIVLALLVLLFLGLLGVTGYTLYSTGVKITTTEPANVPTFDGGDEVYSQATQKVKTFTQASQNHTPATIRLSSDEINTLIARNPVFAKNHIQVFLTLNESLARIQSSIPSKFVSHNLIMGRYLNLDLTVEVNFDSDTKKFNLNLKSAQVGDTAFTSDNLAAVQALTDPSLNTILQGNPAAKSFLDHVTSFEIKDSELVIETK